VQRLKTRAQFEAVLAGGTTVFRTEHFALHRAGLGPAPEAPAPPPQQPATDGHPTVQPAGPRSAGSAALFAVRGEPWIGAVLPRRWARRAVTRNAIRRQIYAVSQDFEPQLPAAAHVVRLRAGFDRTQFPSASSTALKRAVRAELQRLFSGAGIAAPGRASTGPGRASARPDRASPAPARVAPAPVPVTPAKAGVQAGAPASAGPAARRHGNDDGVN